MNLKQEFQNLLTCPICLSQYDTTDHKPMIMSCTNGHTVCSECASKLSSNPNYCRCPLDNELLDIRQKGFIAFRPSVDLKKFVSYYSCFQMCEIHKNNFKEFYCLQCRSEICYKCEKEKHQGHTTDTLEDVWQKAEQTHKKMKKCVRKVGETLGEVDNFFKTKENQVIQNFELEFNAFVKNLTKKKNAIIEQIRSNFNTMKIYDTQQINQKILSWKESVTNLELFFPNIYKTKNDNTFLSTLFLNEEIMSSLDIKKWAKEREEHLLKTRSLLKNASICLNKDILKITKDIEISQGNLIEMIGKTFSEPKVDLNTSENVLVSTEATSPLIKSMPIVSEDISKEPQLELMDTSVSVRTATESDLCKTGATQTDYNKVPGFILKKMKKKMKFNRH